MEHLTSPVILHPRPGEMESMCGCEEWEKIMNRYRIHRLPDGWEIVPLASSAPLTVTGWYQVGETSCIIEVMTRPGMYNIDPPVPNGEYTVQRTAG